VEVHEIAPRVWRAHAQFGFMEQPDLPALLQRAQAKGYPVDPATVTYFIGRETVVPREDGQGLPRLVQSTFAFLLRNSSEAMEYFRLPRDMVVEIAPSGTARAPGARSRRAAAATAIDSTIQEGPSPMHVQVRDLYSGTIRPRSPRRPRGLDAGPRPAVPNPANACFTSMHH